MIFFIYNLYHTEHGTVIDINDYIKDAGRSLVEVEWENEVDLPDTLEIIKLKCEKGAEFQFSCYYPDHLPTLGKRE